MLQQMTEIILIKTEKTSLNLSKQWNITNYTATADTLLVDEHTASIVKEKTYIFTLIISLVILQLFRTVKQKGWDLQTQWSV